MNTQLRRYLFICFVLLIAGCDMLSISSDNNKNKSTIENSDPFEIDSFNVNSSLLVVSVSFSGGCEEHKFEAVWDHNIGRDGNGNQLFFITILHDSKGDQCEAAVQEELNFDLDDLLDGNFQTGDKVELINGSK